jgi:hypothetical protein
LIHGYEFFAVGFAVGFAVSGWFWAWKLRGPRRQLEASNQQLRDLIRFRNYLDLELSGDTQTGVAKTPSKPLR